MLTAPDLELQKPGAGVPTFERLFLKYIAMPLASRSMPWPKAQTVFRQKTVDILTVYKAIPPLHRSQKILIDRLTGLEDSSRYWSANMVLEHVMIVTKGVTSIILSLAEEKPVPFEVRTQDVKPTGTLNEGVIELFEAEMRQSALALENVKNHYSVLTHNHPWFGPMNAQKWHTLLPLHHNIHLHQLRQISKVILAQGE